MPALTIGIGGGLIAEHDDDEGQRLQCASIKPHPECANSENERTKEQLSDSHDRAGDR